MRLKLSVSGTPRATVTVKGGSINRTVHNDATLRLPVGSYRIPLILYAPGITFVNWDSSVNNNQIGSADVFAVFVR